MKYLFVFVGFFAFATAAAAQDINFGDDSSQWANDAECDDRRFYGPGMAMSLSWENVGRDATDCQGQFRAGRIALWSFEDARAATECSAIDFGNDSGDWANDGECDDPRFEGIGVDVVVAPQDRGRDASDCRRACDFGLIGLRDY